MTSLSPAGGGRGWNFLHYIHLVLFILIIFLKKFFESIHIILRHKINVTVKKNPPPAPASGGQFLMSFLFKNNSNFFRGFRLTSFSSSYHLINYVLILLFIAISFSDLQAARIKDIATIEGTSGMQVIGYGLVSGLGQAGDSPQSSITMQSVVNMLKRFGLTVPTSNPKIRNVAAVMVTATIPAFSRKGSKVDVQVSSIGDSKTLQGGVLLMTPLSTAQGVILGMAQGAVSVGGYDYESLGSRTARNFVTTGRVPNGLILETEVEGQLLENQILRIVLREPDFTTATRVATAINGVAGLQNAATAVDAASIQVQIPANITQQQLVATISQIELLNVTADPVARVVINERTGTIVVGGNVELLPAVVAHSGLEISIQRQVIVPQPAPFTIRPTQPAETASITTQEQLNPATALVVSGATVTDMANALNQLKVSPRDLISIFQALKEAGALQGELVIQ